MAVVCIIIKVNVFGSIPKTVNYENASGKKLALLLLDFGIARANSSSDEVFDEGCNIGRKAGRLLTVERVSSAGIQH